MTETVDGLPFWTIEFDKDGTTVDPRAVDNFLGGVIGSKITDLFMFSHGWNNDRPAALSLYERFFEQMAQILRQTNFPKKTADARIGLAGIIWPSILWPDDAPVETAEGVVAGGSGGAASIGASAAPAAREVSPREIREELKKTYSDDHQRKLIDDLTELLETKPGSDAALVIFKEKLNDLLTSEPTDGESDRRQPDYAEAAIAQVSDGEWRELLDVLGAGAVRTDSQGGAVGLGDPFKKLWSAAREALRVATYWQMKQRAGIVGRKGLGAKLLPELAKKAPATRVHLLGHSFGARLVSFSLAGLPPAFTGAASPVKSLFLLQGAFSHYAFADRLPHDMSRSGMLKGMADRVDGPLVTTHSLKDLAVGIAYPAASFLNRDDAAAIGVDQSTRWGAMGHDGAQAVGAATAVLAKPGTSYPFKAGKWLNLDGNRIIIHGAPPSGAHSDIVHPDTAWAALSAAGIV